MIYGIELGTGRGLVHRGVQVIREVVLPDTKLSKLCQGSACRYACDHLRAVMTLTQYFTVIKDRIRPYLRNCGVAQCIALNSLSIVQGPVNYI